MAMLHKKYPQVSKEVLISVYRGGERNNNNNNSSFHQLPSSILTVNVFVYSLAYQLSRVSID